MTKGYILLIALFCTILFNGCKSGADLTEGDSAYKNEQYFKAIDIYKKAYASTKDKKKKGEIAYKIAESMRMNRDFVKAEGWYQKALSMGYSDPEAYRNLGEVQKMNEKYEDALNTFETYQKENPSDNTTDDQIKVIKSIIDFKAHPKTRYIVEPFKVANSPYNDYSPVLLKKEGLVFTSDREGVTGKKTFGRTGGNYSDLWLLPKKKVGKIEKMSGPAVKMEGEVNTEMNEGTAAFDPKGNVMYYTECNPYVNPEKSKQRVPNCNIYMVTRKGKGWGDPTKLPFCTDTTIDYGQPALSPDGNTMIFSMDGPNTKGGHDLYFSNYVKRSRTWSDPVSLGDVINTKGDEMFPYFFNDTTLYFSSDGHVGIGGLDIFVAYGRGDTWSKPKNLKYPLNSGGDDFGVAFNEDGMTGYFSSNRLKSRGDDIYSFTQVPLVFTLAGTVTDSVHSHLPVDKAIVTLYNLKNSQKQEVTVGKDGKYKFKLDPETDYRVSAAKNGYFPSEVYIKSTRGLEFSTDLYQDLTLAPPSITVRGIYYDLDKANIKDESKPILDSLIYILNTYPNLVIELGSHTDCRASVRHNDSLSQARSDSCVAYLVNHGIDKDRLVAKGYGESQLLNRCACEPNNVGPGVDCTEEEHAINRRTTVQILRWDFKPKNEDENNGDH